MKKEELLKIKKEINSCVCCYDAICDKIYQNIEPSRIIRALKFNNLKGARLLIKEELNYLEKNIKCLDKCPLNIDIDTILKYILDNIPNVASQDKLKDIDISSEICGVKTENPFLLSSSVVSSKYEMCKRALEMGWGGVVTKTISMIPMHESSPRFSALKNENGSFLGFKNIEQLSEFSVSENMEMIKKLKKEFPTKIIIASIMGRDNEEWAFLTKEVTKAGADLIELNFSCPNMKEKDTGSAIGQNEELVEEYTRIVKNNTNIPILAKMTPNITDMCIPALAAKKGGADGIAAINTIKSITSINLDTHVPEPEVNQKASLGGYSGQAVKPIALRFIAEMVNNKDLSNIDYSGMGGIYSFKDALEFIHLGCTTIQVTTSVMEYGYRIIEDLIQGLKIYMLENNYQKVSDIVGLSNDKLVPNEELEKDTIELPVFNYDNCIGCGRCYLSCRDGGHQAIKFNNKKPILIPTKCKGCHLCRLVCPARAITKAKKRIVKND